jgi:ornithine carbamoyltransferase
MKNSLLERRGKSLLMLDDLSDVQMLDMVDLAIELKAEKETGREQIQQKMARQNIALIFEKPSTRTRCATTVAAYDEGAQVAYLGKNDIHLGKKESVKDTAQVLGRMFDGILFRGFAHATVEGLAEHSGIPVWNGLTDESHPTQILADLMTVKQAFGKLKGLKLVYMGDGCNNVCNSLMLGCAKAGIHFVNCCPPELSPSADWVKRAQAAAERNGSTIEICHEPMQAVVGANVVYTDVWVSMGEESQFDQKVALLKPYQVNMPLMEATGNLAGDQLIFLHCLPAFHNKETVVSQECGALEVTDDVFSAPFSRVFDEAENRMHTIKAMMVASLGV